MSMPLSAAGPIARLTLALILLACLAGCTILGYSLGSEADERRTGTPVALEQAGEIERGTPLRVVLSDGGFVRGFFLGTVALDSAGAAGRRPALRLGVGNRELTERMFAAGHMLAEPTTADVPDTLVFPLDRVRGLSIPVPGHSARVGATAGAAADVTVVLVVLALIGGAALALIGISK
jgi:hypothetical protein